MTSEPVDEFISIMSKLNRGESVLLETLLTQFDSPVDVDGTHTTVRTHFVASDVNAAPAVDRLAETVAAHVVDFCIPRAKIHAAFLDQLQTGSTAKAVRLARQAAELFVRAEDSGEGGELLLFLLMEGILRLPQLLSKMPLKTSGAMHVHGSDGVHGRLAADGTLDLYWGESKIYKDSSSAFSDCFESVAPFLLPDGHEARKRDLMLVRDNLNVQQLELAAHLITYFDEDSPESLNVRWNAVCLVGFDMANYPNVNKLEGEALKQVKAAVLRWSKSVGERVTKHKLSDVRIDVFCVPFPDVGTFRKAVRMKLGIAA